MNINTVAIDDAVLALLFVTLHDENRAWKCINWAALNRLHHRGLIGDPVNKAKSVILTPSKVTYFHSSSLVLRLGNHNALETQRQSAVTSTVDIEARCSSVDVVKILDRTFDALSTVI